MSLMTCLCLIYTFVCSLLGLDNNLSYFTKMSMPIACEVIPNLNNLLGDICVDVSDV